MQKFIYKRIIAVAIILNIIFINNISYADLLTINPTSHIYKRYTDSEKAKLNDNTLDYEEVDDLVHLNNATVKSNWNSYENNKDNNEVYSDYLDAADALDSLADSATTEVNMAMYRAQADAMRINADNSLNDSNINFLNYLIVEKNLALSTKILFIKYEQSLFEEIIALEDSNEAKRALDTAKLKLELGSGTNVENLTAKKNESDANAATILANSNVKTNLRSLLINCGKSINEDVKIGNFTFPTLLAADVIDLEKDYEKALTNNLQLDIYKRKYENANTTEIKNQYQILIDAAPKYIYSDLEKKYSDILDAKSTILNLEISQELYIEEYNKATSEYTNGNISSKEYETYKYNKNVSEYKLASSYGNLMIALETYNAAVDGLATAGNS